MIIAVSYIISTNCTKPGYNTSMNPTDQKEKVTVYAPICRLAEKEKISLSQPFFPKLNGSLTSWHTNGNRMEDIEYKDGKLSGQCRRFYECGKYSFVASGEDGKLDGRYKRYDEAGKLCVSADHKSTIFLKNGKQQSEHHYQKDIDSGSLIWCEDIQDDENKQDNKDIQDDEVRVYVSEEVEKKIKEKMRQELFTCLQEVSVIPDLIRIMWGYAASDKTTQSTVGDEAQKTDEDGQQDADEDTDGDSDAVYEF